MNTSRDTSTISRRQFASRVATAAAATAVAAHELAADQAQDAQSPAGKEQPAVARTPREPTDAERITDVIRRRYPHDQLTPDVLDNIADDVRSDFVRSRILSASPLRNSDEPAFVFAAWRGDDP